MGLNPIEVWQLTPHEIALMAKGYGIKRQQQAQDMLYLAWHIEALARQKKLPKLETLLKIKPKQAKKHSQDIDELIDIAKRKGLKGPWGK